MTYFYKNESQKKEEVKRFGTFSNKQSADRNWAKDKQIPPIQNLRFLYQQKFNREFSNVIKTDGGGVSSSVSSACG
jgi:hypothetical protein